MFSVWVWRSLEEKEALKNSRSPPYPEAPHAKSIPTLAGEPLHSTAAPERAMQVIAAAERAGVGKEEAPSDIRAVLCLKPWSSGFEAKLNANTEGTPKMPETQPLSPKPPSWDSMRKIA